MEIKNFKIIDKGCLKYAFTIVIPEWGDLEIDCTYFEKENAAYWINYAAKEYTNKEGKKKSWNQVRWPQPVLDRLNKAIREKVNEIALMQTAPDQMKNEEELPF